MRRRDRRQTRGRAPRRRSRHGPIAGGDGNERRCERAWNRASAAGNRATAAMRDRQVPARARANCELPSREARLRSRGSCERGIARRGSMPGRPKRRSAQHRAGSTGLFRSAVPFSLPGVASAVIGCEPSHCARPGNRFACEHQRDGAAPCWRWRWSRRSPRAPTIPPPPPSTSATVAAPQRISGIAAGNYDVRLCDQATAARAGTWDSNDWVDLVVFVMQSQPSLDLAPGRSRAPTRIPPWV